MSLTAPIAVPPMLSAVADKWRPNSDNHVYKQEPQERSRVDAMHVLDLGNTTANNVSTSSSLVGTLISESALDILRSMHLNLNRIHRII